MGAPLTRGSAFSVPPDFIKRVEDELVRRLGRLVALAVGDGIVAARVETGQGAAEPVIVMRAALFVPKSHPGQWADLLEPKLRGQELSGRLAARAADAEHLLAEIQQSAGPEQTGAIVLHHVGEYDEEFFEALAELIARESARHHLRRARKFEALQEYLRVVRRRARKGQVADMWEELAWGAAHEGGTAAPVSASPSSPQTVRE